MRFFVKSLLVGLTVLSVCWFLGFVYFVNTVFSYVDKKVEGVKVPSYCGIAVLTGGRYRIAKGLELLEEGKGKRLLISGVQDGVKLHEIAALEKVHLYDDMPIDLGYKARDTVGNAKEIKDWAQKYGFKYIYAVTSFYHVPRSQLELRHYLPEIEVYFVAVSSGYVRRHWWLHFGSFKFLMAEYAKFIAVWMQYAFKG